MNVSQQNTYALTSDRDLAVQKVSDSVFRPFSEQLLELLQPSIRIGIAPIASEQLPAGASRLGGYPDLPADFTWPSLDGRQFALVAQINLRELPFQPEASPLPSTGWLCFFFDAANEAPFEDREDHRASWHVAYFDEEVEALERTGPPAEDSQHESFPYSALGYSREWTLPSFGSILLDEIGIPADLRGPYEELVFAVQRRAPLPEIYDNGPLGRLRGRFRQWWIGNPIHRMFGHPEHFQVDPRIDWEKLATHQPVSTPAQQTERTAARSWQLLLQIDAYRNGPNWVWGDHGTLYFGIHQSDLAAKQFDNVQWTIECG